MAKEPFQISSVILLFLVTAEWHAAIFFIQTFLFVKRCSCGDFCYYYSYAYSSTTFYYCDTGCCGYYYSRECCSNIGTIAGAVVGGLVVLGIIIGIVACCIVSQQKQKRRIKQQQRATGIVTIVNTTGITPYSHPPPDYSPFGPAPAPRRPMGGDPSYPPPGPYGNGGMMTTNHMGATGGMVSTSHAAPPPYAEKS